MLFKRIYDNDLAQASYLIGCQANNTAMVVDARRDIQVYLDEAAKNNMEIVAVTETHIHADYLSGSRELAEATGAKLYLSDEGGPDWLYRFPHEPLKHGDTIKLGNIVVEARYTPGHTLEHISFLVTDGATTENPGFYLTGDFVFVGDIGRPDLLDEAAGGEDTRFPMAKLMFQSLKDEFLNLPDYVQVWPGHGAGSACGKALGAIDSSTVGYERLFAWWATYLANDDEAGFIEALLEGQPDAPTYFGRMKRQNRAGPAILGDLTPLHEYQASELKNAPDTVLVDTRPAEVVAKGMVPGSLHVPAGKSFATWGAWVIDPERDDRDIVVLAADEAQAAEFRDSLLRVGVDKVRGYITSLDGLEKAAVPSLDPTRLETLDNPMILDVRTKNEYDGGYIPGSTQLHGGRVMWNLDKLPKDRPVVTLCQSGARNAVVSSALRAAGFDNVVELEGSYVGWKDAQKATVTA